MVYLVGDFETTVFDGQKSTEVWASASVQLGTEDVKIFNNINDQFEYFSSFNQNIIVYYHNLKFDGNFWLSYFMVDRKFEQAYVKTTENCGYFLDSKDMPNNTFTYCISDMGQWYNIKVKYKHRIIEFRDSLKLLPFSVRKIGKSFGTKHKKLEIEYTGYRHAYGIITDEEKSYIANDVLVVKEALEIMFNEGHTKLTIGSCCLSEFTKLIGTYDYGNWFPNIYEIPIDESIYGSVNAGEYVRKSYNGGWCYLVRGKENKMKHNGTTADVNSLYPSMMSSESGNAYPVGKPNFWKGKEIPKHAKRPDAYYFIRVKTRFYIKPNHLPFIHIKHSMFYDSTECLETSDILDSHTGKYISTYTDTNGIVHDTRVELTLTQTDYILIQEHYNLVDFEILDGCWFFTQKGIFDPYIEKYKQIKMTSKGAIRELAKLFLNNLYGKLASSTNSSFKYAYLKEDNSIGFIPVSEHEKKPGYIPVGSAITSYARNFTIRAAQKNYHGINKAGFIYADTDSIHCDLPPSEIVGIKVHDTNFCCWKLESCWDDAIFVRQKTYAEHITHENLEPCEPVWNVKCAGMPEKCKNLFLQSIDPNNYTTENIFIPNPSEKYTDDELSFLSHKRTIEDFKIGLTVPSKLLPKRIPGGVILADTYYKLRD